MILLIDNYDSFTYNIAQYLKQLGQKLTVYKNDEITIEDIYKLSPDAIVIGPGPGTPDSSGITLSVIDKFAGHTPILGVCLGHQAIVQAFGGKVIRATQVMHGRVSKIYHTQQGVLMNIPIPFNATRYHSLVIDVHQLPEQLEVTAWTQDTDHSSHHTLKNVSEVMGIQHKHLSVHGVQFHPESILSEAGFMIFNNFLRLYHLSSLADTELPTLN